MNCRLHFTEGSAASRCQTLTIRLETHTVCEQSKELISDKKKNNKKLKGFLCLTPEAIQGCRDFTLVSATGSNNYLLS